MMKTEKIENTRISNDFFIYRKVSKSLVGFVGCKKITADLKEIQQSEQIKKIF
ncbi:hypothetical protein [Candidatus Endomicrobiellum trichonymphae]|uniref:hypothetical protein n=1 Tax=Endomicrobium trichonymphae TaxID=1408204 RepID=UPI0013052E75|nr:hypothetical protein [Candidatus Endomicrobium trichonymphae]